MTRDELIRELTVERFAHTTPPPPPRWRADDDIQELLARQALLATLDLDDEPSTPVVDGGLHLTVIDQPDPLTPWVAHLEAPDGQRLRRLVETVWIPGVSGDRE